jgi:hypothetical protein
MVKLVEKHNRSTDSTCSYAMLEAGCLVGSFVSKRGLLGSLLANG